MKSPPLLLRPSFYLPPLRSLARSYVRDPQYNRNRTEREEKKNSTDRRSNRVIFSSISSCCIDLVISLLYSPFSSSFPSEIAVFGGTRVREVKQQSSPYELSIEPDLATHRGNAPDLSSISYRAQFARKIFRRRLLPDNDFFLLTIFFNFFFSPLSSSSRSIDFVNSLDERNSMIRRSLSLMQRSSKSVKRYRSIIYIYICVC